MPLLSALALAQAVRHDEIVVTGTAGPVPLEEADRSVAVLPVAGDAPLSSALVDFLRLDPSVDVRARAPGGIQTDVSIRGASFGQALVLVDGHRLNDAQTGHHNMDIPVPMEAVERIEILRGSGSTLYGSDAIGGVVNVITRKPEAAEIRVSAGAGNFGTNTERVSASASAGRISGQLVAARDFSSGFRPGRDYRNLSLASTERLTTGLGTTSVILGYSDRPYGADQFYGNFNSWENTKTWFAAIEQSIGERTVAAFSFRRHSDLFVLERYRPEYYTNHHADDSYDASLRRREPLSPATTLHYGAEAYRDSIVSTNLGEHTRGRAAGYLSFDARAMRRFSFSAGAREEMWRRGRAQLSPAASAAAWLSSKWKLRASASRAFRVPSYTELYYTDPANIGNANLQPESAWTYEAGADWAPADTVRLSAAVFERRETNGIDYVRSPGAPWAAVNFASLRFRGAELSAAAGHFTFSYQALTGARAPLAGLESKYVFNYPTQSGVASWYGSFGRGFIARARLAAVNRRARAPYALADVSVGWARGRARPFLQLTNLAGARYEEISGIVMPGRGVLGGLELALR